jgi:hypothetical protein
MKSPEGQSLKAKEFDLDALRKLNEEIENDIRETLKPDLTPFQHTKK